LARAFTVAGLLLWATSGLAQMPPSSNYPSCTPLDSWSFNDTNKWTSDNGYAPVSFTNITALLCFGNGTSLGLNTNPAWLQYNVYETNGATNLTLDVGSVAFWYSPAWAGTNEGGTGPGQWGRLIEVGGYTSDASFGWWSLYVDDVGANLYFTVQPGDSSTTTYLTAPIAWTTNYWHFIALTYSATNTALYLDGVLATNGPGITAWPGTNVLSGGFYIGSDSNGVIQAQGAFDDLYTYNVPLDSNTVYQIFNSFWADYYLTPYNMIANISSAPSTPSYTPVYEAITGLGSLQLAGSGSAITSTNVWITNVVVTATGSGTNNMVLTFTIQGGLDGAPYDVFAYSALSFGTNGIPWAWMGQGYHGDTYLLTNLPSTACFLILGTPQSSSGSGLTDAYELLVLKTDPNGPQSDSEGVPFAWYAINGLSPNNGGATQDPDQDGLLNYQEYLYGTQPQVSEGFAIWVSTPNGTSSIP
jgi:hypothetical protein